MIRFFNGNSQTNSSAENVVNFDMLDDSNGLPFPLSLPMIWKLILSSTLLLILLQGTRMRFGIICYINSPESALGAINYLIWIDEINGVLLGISIAIRIMFILSPYPISHLLGSDFCLVTEFVAISYIIGMTTWGCYIAFFRVLYIKAHTWLKNGIGVGNLLWLLLTIGVLQTILIGIMSVYADDESIVKRFCNHLSIKDIKIMEDYQVRKVK
jgi:hypothetical protein